MIKNSTTSLSSDSLAWHFKPLDESDLPLLLTWFKNPHVAAWWPTPETDELLKKFLERIRSKDTLGFIVYLDKTPLGYIQYYHLDPHNPKAGDLWVKDLPQTTIGTDQFIGEPAYIGKGYGTLFIKAFIKYLHELEPTITTIIVDPEVENKAAIRCYEKVGFKPVGIYESSYGKILLMRYDY